MRWYECVKVAGWQGLGAACTPHEVARMSFMIIEALGIVLDELFVHALVLSCLSRCLSRSFFLFLLRTCEVYIRYDCTHTARLSAKAKNDEN